MLFAPNYYTRFSCIADQCRHSCCIGWEIDIDDEAYAYYSKVEGDFGKRLKEHISSDTPHQFILDEKERCPFLSENNLCDIYTVLGEGHLCQICSDHPRFRNVFENRTEIGLGLSCEAAAKLILTFPEKARIVNTETNEEITDFPERDRVFSILQNREKQVQDRISELFYEFGICFPQKTFSEWKDIFLSLEILDHEWEALLRKTKTPSPDLSGGFMELAREQFLVYFVFRYMHYGLSGQNFAPYLAFAYVSLFMVESLCKTPSDFLDIARLYSSEIEYCPENVEDLIFEIEIG